MMRVSAIKQVTAIERGGSGTRRQHAAAEEGAFEGAQAVHAATAKAGGLANGIQAVDRLAAAIQRAAGEIGLDAAEALAADDELADRDQRHGLAIEDGLALAGAQAIAAITAQEGDATQLFVVLEALGLHHAGVVLAHFALDRGQLDGIVAELRADRDLKVAAQRLKHLFAANAETLLHGDLHTGSIMVTPQETKVIDPEFAFYGPMAFDVGMLLANFWMAYFSQSGHEKDGDRESMREYLLDVVIDIWDVFRDEFARLWRSERKGILYQAALFEDRGDSLGAEQALDEVLQSIWVDMRGFAGVEMHRRILGLAHNADFETIGDESLRARCEAPALRFGRHLAVNRGHIHSVEEANGLALLIEKGTRP